MWRPSSAKTGKQLPRSGQTTSSSFSENSEALGRRKGPRSNNLGPLLYIPRRARTINSAGLPSNGRRGESSDHRQLLCASPPSSRTDRGILPQQSANCCNTGQRGVSLEAATSRVPSGTPPPSMVYLSASLLAPLLADAL